MDILNRCTNHDARKYVAEKFLHDQASESFPLSSAPLPNPAHSPLIMLHEELAYSSGFSTRKALENHLVRR